MPDEINKQNVKHEIVKCSACGEELNPLFKTCRNCGKNHTIRGGFLRFSVYCGALLSIVGVVFLLAKIPVVNRIFNPQEKYVSIDYVGPDLNFEVSNFGEKKATITSAVAETYIKLPKFLTTDDTNYKNDFGPIVQMRQFGLSISHFNVANQAVGTIEPILPGQTKKITFSPDINLLGGTNHLNYVHNKIAEENDFPVKLPSLPSLYPELIGQEKMVYEFCDNLNADSKMPNVNIMPETKKDNPIPEVGVIVPFTCQVLLGFENDVNYTPVPVSCETEGFKKIRVSFTNAFGACSNINGLLNSRP